MLELKAVSAGYEKEKIITDFSVKLKKGELVSIIGANGSGKTTLLKTVLGFIKPFSGEIMVDGISVSEAKRQQIAKKIAYLPQGKNVPDMTVEQMVLHGRFPHLSYPRRYSRKDYLIVKDAIEKMGLSGLEKKPLTSLSGGMRQKAYIAMCLTQDVDYIVLDEPTTYLDIAHSLELMGILKQLTREGKSIITVMHDLTLAFSFSDKILLLNDGKPALYDDTKTVAESDVVKNVFGVKVEFLPDKNCYCYNYS